MQLALNNQSKQLIIWGAVLFLLGLMQGGLIPYFLNTRMALSAHLAAVQSGMALMIVGLIWQLVDLSDKAKRLALIFNIAGMYLVWLAITIAAIVGASKVLPIAGAGYSASASWEMVVEVIVTSGSVLGLVATLLIVFGLYKNFRSA